MTLQYVIAGIRRMPRVKHVHHFAVLVASKGGRERWGCINCPAVDPNWYRNPAYRPRTPQRPLQGARGAFPMDAVQAHVDDIVGAPPIVRVDRNVRTIEKLNLSSITLGTGPSLFPGGEPVVVRSARDEQHATDFNNEFNEVIAGQGGFDPPDDAEEIVDDPDDPDLDDDEEEAYGSPEQYDNDGNDRKPEDTVYLDPEHPHADVPDEGPADYVFSRDELSDMKLPGLRSIAKDLAITGTSRMLKADLVQSILDKQKELIEK